MLEGLLAGSAGAASETALKESIDTNKLL